jgi:hypothetical protein
MPVNMGANPAAPRAKRCSAQGAALRKKEAIIGGHESKQTDQKRRYDGREEKQERVEDTNPLRARRGNS